MNELLKLFENFGNLELGHVIMWVIGGLLTIGCVQISYQTIVQGFKAIIENLARRIGSGDKGAENV